jgi:hypothetical protein
MRLVYQALAPYPAERSLEDMVERCFTREYEETIKTPRLTHELLQLSILYHRKRMEEQGTITEVWCPR